MALPISWRGTLTQYAGRLHRLNASKKEVIIYDYVDFEAPLLAKMYAKRRTGYKAIGCEIALPENSSQVGQLTLKNLGSLHDPKEHPGQYHILEISQAIHIKATYTGE